MEKKNVPELFGSLVFDDRVMRSRLSDEVYSSLKKTIDENVRLDGPLKTELLILLTGFSLLQVLQPRSMTVLYPLHRMVES